jgi:hypothetical protein
MAQLTKVDKLEKKVVDYFIINNKNIDINYENVKFLEGKINETHSYSQQIEKELNELKQVFVKLTQQRGRFQHNLMYVEVVEDIITSTETEWENKSFNNMLVKLVGKDEVYKVFISTTNAPVIGNTIHFIFNADENKLSKLKVL